MSVFDTLKDFTVRVSYLAFLLALCLPAFVMAEGENTDAKTNEAGEESAATARSSRPGKIMYVTDNAFYYLRSAPKHNVVQKGSVNSGDPVKVLEESNGFSLIEDLKGRQKWIETKNLQAHESYKVQVASLQKVNSELNAKLANIDSEQARELKALKSKYSSLYEDNRNAHATIQEQQKKITALEEENAELTNQVENSEQQIQTHWAKVGASLIGIGVILGLILVYIPKPHRRRKDIW